MEEEEGSGEEVGIKSEDPDGIYGMTEEFIVCLVRAVKETKKDETCCYHCSSMEHFIHKCLLVKTSRYTAHLKWKEGMAWRRESRPLQSRWPSQRHPRRGCPRHKMSATDFLLESQPLSLVVWGRKRSEGKEQW